VRDRLIETQLIVLPRLIHYESQLHWQVAAEIVLVELQTTEVDRLSCTFQVLPFVSPRLLEAAAVVFDKLSLVVHQCAKARLVSYLQQFRL
jgi:hypothetical protein